MRSIRRLATLLLWPLLAATLPAQATPQIEHWTTANGARVYFVHAPELPMADIRVVFDAAGARDGDKPGTALLTNALLSEGAGELDADTIAERFESIGAQFGSASLKDMAVVNLRSLTRPELLEQAVETLATVVTMPTFPEASLERERQRLLIALQAKRQSPAAIASEAFFQALYGDHPYARDPAGTEASLETIGRDDLVKFHQRYYVGANAVVAIVGDLSRQQAERVAERVVGRLPKGLPAPPLPEVKPLTEARTIERPFPSSQTHILVGQPGMKRGDPDYFPLYVGNHILGGSGLVSRLSTEVREKRGLSYSTYSYFSPMRRKGPFQMGLQTRNDQAEEALEVMRDTLEKFIEEGPTEEELTAAKQNLTGGFALRLDSNKKIVEYVAMIGFYGLPLDYLDTQLERIEAVTREQIRDAFQHRLDPATMVMVLVGGSAPAEAP